MANKRKGQHARTVKKESLPFSKENYVLFLIGLGLIAAGYIALAQPPWDSFLSLTLAPILLVLGYLVVIPVAILYYRKKNGQNKKEAEPATEE